MNTASNVLGLLYDRKDGFYSLSELAGAAGVSADRLNEVIEHLTGRGFELEHHPAHGLRLVQPMPLDARLIERGLGARRIGRHAIVFGEVDCTNDIAADSARQEDADGLVVLAEHQRHGRGRLGRVWLSPPGENILMSVLLVEQTHQLPHHALTVATGLAVAEGIDQACGGLTCALRWPNDVLLAEEKTAGVLVELRRTAAEGSVVLGVGVNVNAAPPPGSVGRPATCLREHVGHPVDRIEVVRAILQRLDAWADRLAGGALDVLHDAWVARCGMINQRVTVLFAGRPHVGRVLDVSPLEGLILVRDDGRREHLPAEGASLVE